MDRFKDLSFTIVLYVLASFYFARNDRKYIIRILSVYTLVSFLIKFSLFFDYQFTVGLISNVFYDNTTNLIIYNLNRFRVYFETFEEVYVPILFYFSLQKSSYFFPLFINIFVIFSSIISGFRTRLIMMFLGFTISTSLLLKSFKRVISIFILILFIYIGSNLSNRIYNVNILDRFLLDRVEDYSTIISRFDNIKEALNIGFSYPLFGVGLGNYDYYLQSRNFSGGISLRSLGEKMINQEARRPHNIFAFTFVESGITGFLALIILLIYFFRRDLEIIKTDDLSKAMIISFWTLFLYALSNPTTNLAHYNNLLFLIRAFIR